MYFVNSGSEANDLAMTMARLHTGNYDLLALRNCYHGASPSTMGLTAHSTWKYNTPHGFGIHHMMNPDPYRGVFGNDGKAYAADVKDFIVHGTSGWSTPLSSQTTHCLPANEYGMAFTLSATTTLPGQIGGFFAEPIQGVGGAVPLADGYLPEVYKTVREHGGLCISDEVQTGFGRTGSAFWGFQNHGVMPDIVTMAKVAAGRPTLVPNDLPSCQLTCCLLVPLTKQPLMTYA